MIIKDFIQNFSKFKKNKIVLYGIGIKTKEILDNTAFNIIGLMDKDACNIGKFFYGKKVLNEKEVINSADIIIIAAADVYYDIIFKRIAYLNDKYNIPIYFLDGTKATTKQINKNIKLNPYWNNTIDCIKEEIKKYEIISFDIFDTLITRKLTEPQDLVKIIGEKYFDNDFYTSRIETETKLGALATIDKIYEKMPEKYARGKFFEKELELELIMPRYDMVEIFNFAKANNKKIILISDMYYSSDFMSKILEKCGITGYNVLIISSEIGLKKSDGTIWAHYAHNAPKMLHIGDNYYSDIVNANKYGINTFYIMSPFEILKNSSWQNIVPRITNTVESKIVGNIISKVFNSPFALSKTKGVIEIDNLFDVGYILYSAVIMTYVFWILNQKEDKVAFVSRDGWFLKKIYEKFKNNSIYLTISRALISQINLKSKEDIVRAIDLKFYGKIRDYFKVRYGIEIQSDKIINTAEDREIILEIIEKYADKILENSKKQRKLYLKYLKTIFNDNNTIALVDPSYRGTNQKNLEKLIPNKIEGYYCNALISSDNMHALFQTEDDNDATKSKIRRKCAFLEDGILVAPTGTPVKINDDLTFIYDYQGKTQEEFYNKEKIFDGICNFIDDFINIFNYDTKINPAFIDYLAGEIWGENTILTDKVKDTFWIDTIFECIKNEPMFE